MGISFKDSVQTNEPMATAYNVPPNVNSSNSNTSHELLTSESFQPCNDGRYNWYGSYTDDNISIINDAKSISVDNSQINLTQEVNSQYIPFQMPRYYDGIDLLSMFIQIHYVNGENEEDYVTPINVSYSDNYIRFGWLVNEKVTSISGEITFEITARGRNEAGDTYLWRTKPDGKINILKSLSGNGIVEPGTDWYTSFVNTMNNMVSRSKNYADTSKSYLDQTKQYAGEIQNIVNNAEQTVISSVRADLDSIVDNRLVSYYDKTQVDNFVSDLSSAMASIDSLSNLDVKYNTGTGALKFLDKSDNTEICSVVINSLTNLNAKFSTENGNGKITFYNGKTEISSVTIGSMDPSETWTNNLRTNVTAEITEAKNSLKNVIDTRIEQVSGDVTTNTTSINDVKKRVTATEGSISELITKTNSHDTSITSLNSQTEYLTRDLGTVSSSLNTNTNKVAELANAASVMKNDITGIASDIQSLTTDVSNIESKVDNLDIRNNEYDVEYVDNTFTFYENNSIKKSFTIVGGGSGTGSSSTITIERITPSSVNVLTGDSAIIEYNFTSVDNSGDDTGNGTALWYVGNTKVASSTAVQGKNAFDITEYVTPGSNTVKLSITDSYGNISTKKWTVTIIEFYIESVFDDALFYSDDITFRYIPYGELEKTIHFVLDNVEIATATTAVTGKQLTQAIPKKPHGAHLLKIYMTAKLNEKVITSKPVYKDIIWVDASNKTPIIGCNIPETNIKQYNSFSIPYVVYDPDHNPATVTLTENETLVAELQVDRTSNVWVYKPTTKGRKSLKITCGNVVKEIVVVVDEIGIEISPVKTGLAFDFNPVGKSNSDTNRLWSSSSCKMSVSSNFDWTNGGYQIDEDGDTYFCVKAGTYASINYKLFGDDPKRTGKNFKFIYKCTNVKDYDATVIKCIDHNIGFEVNAQNATLRSEQNKIDVPYCENTYMELEFNILPDSEYREMVMWIDGIPSKVELYSESDNFTQVNPQDIMIGSEDCDVWVYRMKSYTINLNDDEILDNRIADAKNAEEMITRYYRNQIVGATGTIDPDILAEVCPDLRIIKISTPHFTTGKKNEVHDTVVQHIYKNGRPVEDNWTASGSHKGQGTSSDNYGESARNIDINLYNGFTFGDESEGTSYAMTENSMAESYFNIKVNVASSENANNACFTDDYNTFNPYLREARKSNPKVRDTMEFHPCVIFVQETDTTNATVFTDGQWHFYACGDFGNSKKNNSTMGMDPNNHKEFIVEVSNNTDPQCRWLSDDLSNELWDGDTSFEFRYKNPNCTEEEILAGKQAWQRVLSWVKNSTEETFVSQLENYFVKDSLLYFYLFTERHCMVDNRAKNTFWHTTDLIHWDICFDYDNDTADGNDNEGGLTLTYGLEDTDTIGTKSVFNASDSKLWCSIRDYMYDDLCKMFLKLESNLAWSATRIINKFDSYQNVKPERLWIADMRRKYFRTYEDNGTTSYLPMMYGSKRHQRKQFETYQEKYMSSKYVGAACTSDVMTIRGYTPLNWTGVKPDGTFKIKPYADTYIVNRYGSNLVRKRAKRGNTYNITCPIDAMNDTEVYTYNASIIQSIGDISGFYAGYCDFSAGIKLTDLLVGSGVQSYANTNMTDFSVGNNVLLECLNLQNLPNLKKSVSLIGCTNLVEFLADGSGITGVIFAPGGKIEKAHLPAVASITGKNLYKLTDFNMSNYENLVALSLDNCPTINELDVLSKATNLKRLRLTGINWDLENTDLLDRLLKLSGTDENGYNTACSVLAGRVHVPIMRQQKLELYTEAWKDLEIVYDTMVSQYTVTFKNADGTILDVQYVDKGADAVDPITRDVDPIPVPHKESTVSTSYTFKEWDSTFTGIFANKVVTALYNESIRDYTVRYEAKGRLLQETTAPYGTTVYYLGDTPVYTDEESAYKYYLFKGWDKSGFVDGDKVITAEFDSCEYYEGIFDNKDPNTLRPVELYAILKLGIESQVLFLKDEISVPFGHDYTFKDVEEKVLINQDVVFNGTNYIDTGIPIMNEDSSFVLAIDFEFARDNAVGNVLAQCFQSDGSNGFKLWYGNGNRMTWGTESMEPSVGSNREMVVLRHIKGENQVYVYSSNLSGTKVNTITLDSLRPPVHNSTLVFGCSKADDGVYENFGLGTIHWSKIWYSDLGDVMCKNIASWIHEALPMEIAKFKGYYLSDASSKRAPITLLAKNLISMDKMMSASSSNSGGWGTSTLNTWMNTRMFNAIPDIWRSLIKPVKVYSSVGMSSSDISYSDCNLFIPSIYELDTSVNTEPYINETNATISYMTSDEARLRKRLSDTDIYRSYWTRSPNASYNNYFYRISETGYYYGYYYPTHEDGILVMLSFSV